MKTFKNTRFLCKNSDEFYKIQDILGFENRWDKDFYSGRRAIYIIFDDASSTDPSDTVNRSNRYTGENNPGWCSPFFNCNICHKCDKHTTINAETFLKEHQREQKLERILR